tara:strand:- start:220 stop:795 length:576 start_codon:yes stop_codon:yes gene_type:complete
MASTLTLPTFFTDWVANGVREWMDANEVPCIPFVCAEVEVDRVCAYYYVPTEVSRYIQRLAFSKHLPYTIPPTIYTLTKSRYLTNMEHNTPVSLMVIHGRGQREGTRNLDCEFGRNSSIFRGYQQLNKRGCVLPNGKDKNEAERHFLTLKGTNECNMYIRNGRPFLDERGRGVNNRVRKFKGIKNRSCWFH